MKLGNGDFEREVGRQFVKRTFAANLGPPVERGAAKRQLESGSSDEELVFGEAGEEPVARKKKAKRSDKEAARKFLAKWQQTQCWTITTDAGLQDELLSGKHSREVVAGVDVVQCVQDLVGSVEQQVSEFAPVPSAELAVAQCVQGLVGSVEQQVSEIAPVLSAGMDVAQRVQGLVGSVEQQVTEIAPVPSAGLVGKSIIQAKLAVNTVVQSIPAVVPLNTMLSHVTPESIIAAAGSGDIVPADGRDGADASNRAQQIAQDRDLAQAMHDFEEESDSMEEADDPPPHVQYKELVAVGNNN